MLYYRFSMQRLHKFKNVSILWFIMVIGKCQLMFMLTSPSHCEIIDDMIHLPVASFLPNKTRRSIRGLTMVDLSRGLGGLTALKEFGKTLRTQRTQRTESMPIKPLACPPEYPFYLPPPNSLPTQASTFRLPRTGRHLCPQSI